MPARRWRAARQALGVLDGAAPRRSLSVLLVMLSLRYGAPLLPGLPLPCLGQHQSAHISLDLPKSWCISGSFAQPLLTADGELGRRLWGASLQEGACWFLLLFPCIPI